MNVRVIRENTSKHGTVRDVCFVENSIFGEFPSTCYQRIKDNRRMSVIEQNRGNRTANIARPTCDQNFHRTSQFFFLLYSIGLLAVTSRTVSRISRPMTRKARIEP